jgi:formylglycine-generating enzyme
VTQARLATLGASIALSGCWLALDLDDKEFTLGTGDGGSAGASQTTTATTATSGDHSGMVQITPDGAPAFYVDSTEVTVSAYKAWLDTSPQPAQQEARCSWNDSFVPGECEPGTPCGCDGMGIDLDLEIAISADLPVRCVDFCDAAAYCAGVGKHLCGGQNGVVLYGSPDPSNSAAQSEWFYACSNGGTRQFPYGDQFAPQTCEDDSVGGNDRPRDVGAPACQGGIPGIFDMSGNVEEWVDHCYMTETQTVACFRPGGAYWHSEAEWLDCALWWEQSTSIEDQGPATGFRCCDDP